MNGAIALLNPDSDTEKRDLPEARRSRFCDLMTNCSLVVLAVDWRHRFAWYVGIVHCVHGLQRLADQGRSAIALLRHSCHGLADPVDGSLPSRRRNKAIAPYDRWSHWLIFQRVQKCSTQGRTSTSHDQALR